MLRTRLCDCYSDTNLNVARRLDEQDRGVIFKNGAPFTYCISETNNTQIDKAKYIHVICECLI